MYDILHCLYQFRFFLNTNIRYVYTSYSQSFKMMLVTNVISDNSGKHLLQGAFFLFEIMKC